jgi:hypothetical protein
MAIICREEYRLPRLLCVIELAGRSVLRDAFVKRCGSCEVLEVNAFFFRDERTILHHGVDGADVLSDDAQGYELDRA